MATTSYSVPDQGSSHHYRTEIPNLVDDMGLSPHAFRLYARLKRVAGDAGKCFYTTKQLAEHCQMSVGAISRAKQELVAAQLIHIQRQSVFARDEITIVDLWPSNFAHFAVQDVNAPVQDVNAPVQDVNAPVQDMNAPVQDMNTKEEPLQEEPIQEEPRRRGKGKKGVGEGGAAMPSASQALFSAICGVIGWDWRTLSERDRVQVAQTGKILSQAGYGEKDVVAFMQQVWFLDWRWKKFQQRPTLGQLRQEIGKLGVSVGSTMRRDEDGGGREGDAGVDADFQRQVEEHRARRKAEGSLYFR